MIASVAGTVAAVSPEQAVIEVGGVGLAVQCAPNTLATLRVGQPARLATSLVVREDSLTLYGFAGEDERNMFELVQTASGVGPKLAQAMLAVHSPYELRRAIATADLTALTRVTGIGRKGAEKLVLELRDRIGEIGPDLDLTGGGTGGQAGAGPGWRDQVREGLMGLGWSARDADEAVARVARAYPERDPDVADALKQAMRLLAK
jgi:holliday junction DNA helicase RuvA